MHAVQITPHKRRSRAVWGIRMRLPWQRLEETQLIIMKMDDTTLSWTKKTAAISCRCFISGRQVGFEPTTHGTTIRYSNQLSYNRHVWSSLKDGGKNTFFFVTCIVLENFFLFLSSICGIDTCRPVYHSFGKVFRDMQRFGGLLLQFSMSFKYFLMFSVIRSKSYKYCTI